MSDSNRAGREQADAASAHAAAAQLLEAAPIGVVLIDRDYRVSWINTAALEVFSLRREAVVGRDKRELARLLAPRMIEDGAEVAARWFRRFTGEELGPLECHVLAGDGRSERWIELSLERIERGPLAGGWVEFVRDTTDRTRRAAYAEELRLALEEQRLILDNMAGFTYRHDRNGIFHYVSPSVERITGYSVEEWMRHYTAYLTDNPLNARVVEHTEQTLRTGKINPPYKVEIYHKDRSRIMLEVSEQPYFEGERVAGIVGIALDITDRQRLEQRLQHIDKAQSLGLLAEGIAHDFNNLLTVVLGNAALALEELPPELPAQEALQEIVRTTRRAADLCQQMLAYSGKGTRRFEPLDLSEVAAETGRMLEVSIPRQVRVTYELARDLPPVLGDPVQVRQVALNLVTNAAEAIGDRPGELRLRTGVAELTRAELRAGLSAPEPVPGAYVWLEVVDDGPGMDEATQARIFDPFFSTKVSGRGLGLSTVLGIMRGHEGAIRIWSEPGKGTRFRVLFPAAPAAAIPSAAPEEEAGGAPEPASADGGLVLLIDDDPAVRKVGRRMLEKLGYEVLTAAGGREGLELFRGRRAEIRFCVIDLTMPEMSGEEAFRALRELAPEVRVILTSGFDKSEALKRLGRGVRFEFLQKPFEQAALAEAIQKLCAGARNPRRG